MRNFPSSVEEECMSGGLPYGPLIKTRCWLIKKKKKKMNRRNESLHHTEKYIDSHLSDSRNIQKLFSHKRKNTFKRNREDSNIKLQIVVSSK